tara:strand:- start:203 stop:826 length:624 start_codon:yes stop_codon:yes gene_type:complete
MPNITITGLPVAAAAASTDVFPIVQIDNVTRQITNALIFTSPTITSPTLITPALGTPASGNLSNCTGGPVFTTPNIGISTGTSLSTTGNQVISGAGKQGYTTGSGGVVTQATSKATGVTLNKSTGQITLNNAALAADTTVSFVLTNTVIEANDILVMNHISAGTAGSYLLNAQSAAGSASINVRNITTGSLSEAIVIAFAVIKAVIA